MRIVLQRVRSASVMVDGKVVGMITQGMLLLLGVGSDDSIEDIEILCNKLHKLRIFNDENGKMNLDISQIDGSFLVISQFTLFANAKKGNRPSYTDAAPPEFAQEMYDSFCRHLSLLTHKSVERGIFGANMKVSLINDGPVTIFLDSKYL